MRILALAAVALAGCTEIHVNGDGNTVYVKAGPQAETRAGGDVSNANTTADIQTNPAVSLWP